MERTVVAAPALDLETRETFRMEAERLLRHLSGGDTLIVDLAATRAVDSAGLGALVTVRRLAARQGTTVRLRGIRAEVRVLLTLTRLVDLFEFESAESG